MARGGDMTDDEADNVEDLYRSSKVQCGVMCREVPKKLTASRMSRDRLLQGSLLKCSSRPRHMHTM